MEVGSENRRVGEKASETAADEVVVSVIWADVEVTVSERWVGEEAVNENPVGE